MVFLELAKARYSVRTYEDRKVEPEKLAAILKAASVAPTAANLQPVRLLAVQQSEGLEKIGKAGRIFGAPLAVIVCVDREKAWVRPFDGKSTADIDAAIITDHMMLAAADLGLGSVWIGYFKPDVLHSEFSLPENWEAISILAIGYPKGEPADPERHETQRIEIKKLVSYENIDRQ